MLVLKNCSVHDFKKESVKRRIIPFGVGSWFKALEAEELSFLAEQCPYAIDNAGIKSKVILQGKIIPVYTPDRLKSEKECIVLLISPVFMYDMYMQLDRMNLEGNITCYGFPFMTITETYNLSDQFLEKVLRDNSKHIETSIPRILHGFWFSGAEKPKQYQQCFESWSKFCPSYEIREWTTTNYDTTKHPFLRKAVELGAWAFASDYARLDVLYHYGGFYLDMDVELIKPLDDLLHNSVVCGFSNSMTINLAVLGAKPHHPLVRKLLEVYNRIQVPETREEFNIYYQPSLIRDVIQSTGVKFNGKLQIMDEGIVFLPRTFFYPMDTVLFEKTAMSKYTHTIHYDNFGWGIGETNIREKKIRDNRILFGMIEK